MQKKYFHKLQDNLNPRDKFEDVEQVNGADYQKGDAVRIEEVEQCEDY